MIDCLKERGDARNVYEEFLDTVLLYLYQALDYENHTKFQQNLKEAIEEGAAKMPTIAEHFIEKEGRKDCRKALKGLEQGIREAILETLEVRFEKVTERVREKIHGTEDITHLRNLRKKALTTPSLEEFE